MTCTLVVGTLGAAGSAATVAPSSTVTLSMFNAPESPAPYKNSTECEPALNGTATSVVRHDAQPPVDGNDTAPVRTPSTTKDLTAGASHADA